MTTLNDLATAIRDHVAKLLPELKSCETHPGRFDAAELKRFLTGAPAVRVAILGVRAGVPADDDRHEWPVQIGVFVAAQSAGKHNRAAVAQDIVWAILQTVSGNHWNLPGIGDPTSIRADNLTDAELGAGGATLWAVAWEQVLPGDPTIFAEDGTVPTDLYIGMAPDIGAGHEPDYFHIPLGEPDDA